MKDTYHILNSEDIVVAKFTASKVSEVWTKFNRRSKELLKEAEHFDYKKQSFGCAAWRGITKQGKNEVLRLAKVTDSGYCFENKPY